LSKIESAWSVQHSTSPTASQEVITAPRFTGHTSTTGPQRTCRHKLAVTTKSEAFLRESQN
jgi:hypothetical protein